MVSRQCLPAAGFLAALALLGVAVLPRPVSAVVDGWAAENATARIFADIAGAGYDARTRPGFSRAPTNISAQFRLNSLFAVDPVATSFTLDVGLLLQWTDPRLLLDVPGSYPLPPTQDIRVVGSVDLGNGHGPPHFVWTPDVYFENQISRTVLSEIAKFNPATGGVLLRRHFLVELKGDFDFHSYPFDRQWLPVWLTPWSYNSDEVTMYWAPSPVWPVVNGSTFKHTVWDFETYTIEREVFYSRENLPPYDRLKMNILISRRSTSYIIKVILPIILLVSLTAVNFWLSVDAVTDRLALVITLILTIVSFYNSVSQELPLVNYPTTVDYYVVAAFLVVFLSLIEVATVHHHVQREGDVVLATELDYFSRRTMLPVWAAFQLVLVQTGQWLGILTGVIIFSIIIFNAWIMKYRIVRRRQPRGGGGPPPWPAWVERLGKATDAGYAFLGMKPPVSDEESAVRVLREQADAIRVRVEEAERRAAGWDGLDAVRVDDAGWVSGAEGEGGGRDRGLWDEKG